MKKLFILSLCMMSLASRVMANGEALTINGTKAAPQVPAAAPEMAAPMTPAPAPAAGETKVTPTLPAAPAAIPDMDMAMMSDDSLFEALDEALESEPDISIEETEVSEDDFE